MVEIPPWEDPFVLPRDPNKKAPWPKAATCPRCAGAMKSYQPQRSGIPVLTKTGKIKHPPMTKAQRKAKGISREEGVKPAEVKIGAQRVKVCGKCVYELGRLK